LLLEDAANNNQWWRVFALASLVISVSSQPAEAPSPQQDDGHQHRPSGL